MHERAEESIAEQAMADMLYLTENQGRLRLDLPWELPKYHYTDSKVQNRNISLYQLNSNWSSYSIKFHRVPTSFVVLSSQVLIQIEFKRTFRKTRF